MDETKEEELHEGFLAKLRKKRKARQESRTVIKVKTVGDIPPVMSARRQLGNGEVSRAVVEGYNSAKNDYIRQFNVEVDKSMTNRQFLIREFNAVGIEIPEEGNLDNGVIVDLMERNVFISETDKNRINALRKLASFYIDFYEKVRFSGDPHTDPSMVMEKLEDVYNYLDIMELYYAEMTESQEDFPDE